MLPHQKGSLSACFLLLLLDNVTSSSRKVLSFEAHAISLPLPGTAIHRPLDHSSTSLMSWFSCWFPFSSPISFLNFQVAEPPLTFPLKILSTALLLPPLHCHSTDIVITTNCSLSEIPMSTVTNQHCLSLWITPSHQSQQFFSLPMPIDSPSFSRP